MNKPHYNSVFISDTHLGFDLSKVNYLLNFLNSFHTENLYLVGDIIDFWALKDKPHWDKDCNDVFRKILKFPKVVLTPGNHDEYLRYFTPLQMGSIELIDHTIYVSKTGEKYLIIHGDQFDLVIGKMKWLAMFGHHLYDVLLKLNHYVNGFRSFFGLPYWSLAGYLKSQTKQAISMIQNFEELAVEYAKDLGCDGVICGHIHTPVHKVIDGIHYYNCGDWVESCTALVENHDGKMELIYWHV